jgi:hypothetical protein
MKSDVFVEIAGVSEGTQTVLALQWFVSSVGPAKGDSMVCFTKYKARSIFLQKLTVAQLVKKILSFY